jgi:hypothetical protein
MPEYKWTQFMKVSPESEYVAFSEMGERKSLWSFFNIYMRGRAVQKQLNTAKGLVGYRARLEFLGKKVIMLAVFENESSLYEFAHTGQHAKCMQQTKPDLKEGMKPCTWSISGSNIPPTFDEAIKRIQNKK